MRKPAVRRSAGIRVLLLASALFAVIAATALAAGISGDGTLIGTPGNDNINAGNGNDIIYGLGGSDSINAGNGNDQIDGGGTCPAGDTDTNMGNAAYCTHGQVKPCGQDNFNVGNGNDTIWGNCGPNSINVGSGNDTIYGGPVGDTININGGKNTGTDYIYLGPGGHNSVSTGQGTAIVYAQNGEPDTINCHGNTTVYADKNIDTANNCTTVIYTPPPKNSVRSPSVRRSSHRRTHTRTRREKHGTTTKPGFRF